MHVQARSSTRVSPMLNITKYLYSCYAHRFVLKTKEQRAAEKALLDKSPLKTLTLEEFLESERHKLTGKLTPVTPESFAEWKKKRMDKKAAEEQVGFPIPLMFRGMLASIRYANEMIYRPGKPRMPQVVPCLRAATGGQTAMMSLTTATTTTTTACSISTSCAKKPRQYKRGKKRNDWQSNSGYQCPITMTRKALILRRKRPHRTANPLALLRKIRPPLEGSRDKRHDTAKRWMKEAEKTLPATRASGVAPLDKYYRCIPNGRSLWHSRHESGRTHLSEGNDSFDSSISRYGLRTGMAWGESHIASTREVRVRDSSEHCITRLYRERDNSIFLAVLLLLSLPLLSDKTRHTAVYLFRTFPHTDAYPTPV